MSAQEEKPNSQRQQRGFQHRHFNRRNRQQGDSPKNSPVEHQGSGHVRRESFKRHHQGQKPNHNKQKQQETPSRAYVPVGEPESITGLLEITNKGFGFIRTAENDWAPSDAAIYVPADIR